MAAQAFEVKRATLAAQFNGRKTHKEAHESEKALSFAEERALVDWIKEHARHGIPLHASAVAQHASVICGHTISERWVQHFHIQHPDLKMKWTSNLEKCRAQALNPTAISEFYDILEELIDEYKITEGNIYNMDEKGIQLGMGKRVRAFVDCDQQSIAQVEDGDRELVTLIECVCADGTAIRPGAVFKAACCNLEWGHENPCDAR